MSCSWCKKTDQHYEFCNECNFCEKPICCDCWDDDGTCYYPGEGYCPNCKTKLRDCPACVAYVNGLMKEPDMPICQKHWDKESPNYIWK